MAKEGEPKISLSDLVFYMLVSTERKITSLVKRGDEVEFGSNDRFHIHVEDLSHIGMSKFSMANAKITCEVVYKGDWKDAITIFDVRRSLDAKFGWLNNDLVIPEGYHISGLVADVNVSFNGELCDKIGFQIFHEGDRRYFSLGDTLQYLQCLVDQKKKKRKFLQCFFPL